MTSDRELPETVTVPAAEQSQDQAVPTISKPKKIRKNMPSTFVPLPCDKRILDELPSKVSDQPHTNGLPVLSSESTFTDRVRYAIRKVGMDVGIQFECEQGRKKAKPTEQPAVKSPQAPEMPEEG